MKALSYLNFNGKARDAFEFYKEVFGGTLCVNCTRTALWGLRAGNRSFLPGGS